MSNPAIINALIQGVGGRENINKVWHCMTRLRFDLVDEAKINQQAVTQLPGVLGAQLQSEQYQVIIGPQVNHWYQQIGGDVSQPVRHLLKRRGGWFRCLWIRSPACLVPSCPLSRGRG